MPETAAELSNQNDLFGNLFRGTRPTTNSSSSYVTDTDPVQSEIGEKDIENHSESIPFQEILGQQIINRTARDAVNQQKPNDPAIESSNRKLFQEDIHEVNSSLFHETLVSGSPQRNAKNPNIPNSIGGESDGFSSLTKKGEKGFELNLSGTPVLDTIHSSDILPGTFREHTEPAFQNFSQNFPLKNGVVKVDVNVNIHNPLMIDVNHQNLFTSPFCGLEQRKIDIRKNNQFTNITSSDFLYNTEASIMQNLTDENAIRNNEGVGSNPSKNLKNLQKLDQSIPIVMQEPEFAGSDNAINIKELPTAFKSLAQNVSPENRFNTPRHEIDGQINGTEKQRENDLSKITSKVPSEHNDPGTSQKNEEWNLFDNFTQEESLSNPTPFDTHRQKTHSRYLFPLDTQTTTDGIQSNASNFTQNTEVFPAGGTKQSPSLEGHKDSVRHTFPESFNAGTEHAYNITDQLFQKISLIHHGDKSEIKLHLTPPELGSVKIHFTEENDEIGAKIFVENAEVKAVIENNAHRLKESVGANGVEIHKLEVHIQNNDAHKQKSSENSDSNNTHYRAGSQENRNGGQSDKERNVSNNSRTDAGINTSNLMVDYII
ncbi:MAG: flagellar hook-length control protein FliK [Candidatus Brocadia sp.]|nr:flagellar hook-length control protein FliK [Candidatus Brocadia sp.]